MSITTFKELKEECISKNKTIWEITQNEESMSSEQSVETIRENVLKHIKPPISIKHPKIVKIKRIEYTLFSGRLMRCLKK